MQEQKDELKKISPEDLLAFIAARDLKSLRKALQDIRIPDLAESCEDIQVQDMVIILRALSRDRRPELFPYLSIDLQEKLLNELPDVVMGAIINDMEPDDRTKLLEELDADIRDKILAKLDPDQSRIAWRLLSYPEDSVGRLSNTEFLTLFETMTVNEALSFIRWRYNHTDIQDIDFFFVTDKQGRLLGEVHPAILITTDPPSKFLKEVMFTDVVTLNADDPQIKAVDYFRKYDQSHFPVLDDDNILVGYVTSDDVFDIAEEEATEDIQQFGGQANLEDSYFATPILTLLRKRAGWLSVLFLGELLTGAALKHYDKTISDLSYLIYFLPLIISSGGNSGTQSASLVIRGFAIREMDLADWQRVAFRELVSGLGLGLILGILGMIRSYTWGYETHVMFIVFFTLVGVVLCGALLGGLLPFLFKKIKLDPAISSSPFIASLVDLIGVLIFVNVAIWINAFIKN